MDGFDGLMDMVKVEAFVSGGQIHPIRGSEGYSDRKAGESTKQSRRKERAYFALRKKGFDGLMMDLEKGCPSKFKRTVEAIKEKGGAENPYAVAHAALGKGFKGLMDVMKYQQERQTGRAQIPHKIRHTIHHYSRLVGGRPERLMPHKARKYRGAIRAEHAIMRRGVERQERAPSGLRMIPTRKGFDGLMKSLGVE